MSGSTRAITLTISVRDADTMRQQLERLGPTGETALRRLEDAARKAAGREGLGGIGAAADGASSRLGSAFSLLSSQGAQLLALLGAGGGVLGTMTALVRAGDAFTASMGRLRNATGSAQAAADVYEALYRNALQTGVSVNDSVDAFQRFAVAARAVGATREQVTQLVTGLQRVAIVSGASSQEISSTTLQLAQALASGTLQGDELRSILEAMPLLAEALARQLGVTVGQLRQMGSEGKLTADTVFPALLRATEDVGRRFEEMPLTVERAFGSLSVAANRFLSQLDQAIGLSGALARGLAGAAAALDGARRGVGLLSDEEQLAQMRAQAEALGRRIGQAEAAGDGPSLRAPASRNGIRGGLTGTARTNAGGTAAGDLEADRQQYFALLAEIETRERDAIARRLANEDEAARQAAEARRQRDTQRVDALRLALDAEFKAREEHQKRVRELADAEASGAITGEERRRLERLADQQRDEALRRAAGGGGGSTRQATNDNRELNNALRERESVLRSLETPYDRYIRQIEELGTMQARLEEAQRRGVEGAVPLTTDQMTRATDAIRRQYDEAERGAERVNDTARQLGLTFSSAFEDAIIKGENFRTVLKGIEADIARIIVRKAITEPMANAIGGINFGNIGSSIWNWITGSGGTGAMTGYTPGTVTATPLPPPGGYANGGVFFGGNVVPFARGGIFDTPTFFPMAGGGTGLMGEAGPEAIMPLRRDASGRLGVAAQGGGGNSMSFNISIDARGADAGVEQRIRVGMAMAVQEAQRQFAANINRGGSAAKTVGRRA